MKPLIIAHRGASHVAPENTCASARLAWEMESDAVEIDIRLAGDGEIVVIHDETTDRTTGFSSKVSELSHCDLAKLDAGSYKGERWAGEPIPTLRSILATVPKGKKIVIEIKDTEAILPALKRDLAASGLEASQVVLITFNYDLAKLSKTHFKDYRVLWLSAGYYHAPAEEWDVLTQKLIEQVREAGVDGINLGAAQPIARFCECLKTFLAAEITPYVWTVNDPVDAEALMKVPVAGLTTDMPDCMLALRDGESRVEGSVVQGVSA